MPEKQAMKFSKQLRNSLDHLQRLAARSAVAADRQSEYQTRITRLQERLKRLSIERQRSNLLRGFPRSQRPVLTEVFAAIYQDDKNLHQAQYLIEAIISRLKRTRGGTKKPKRVASR
jgi:septal ring factor EnvC (AmiA/AmiB activator)